MSQSEAPTETKFCSECGEEINRKAEICPECGVRQHDAPDQNNELDYASLGDRFIGHIIDSIFLAILLVPVAIFPDTLAGLWILLWGVFVVFYILILEGIWTNQTVGKYALNMKVAKDDGSKAGISHSLIRNIIGIIGQAFGWIGLLVGAFAIYQSDENKRIGDSAAGTVVIKVSESPPGE